MLLNTANITNNKRKKAKLYMSLFFILSSLFFSINSQAQCAMCRASLEGEGNVAKAQAVNDGIVYLMIIPYILAGFVAVIIYRMYKKRK